MMAAKKRSRKNRREPNEQLVEMITSALAPQSAMLNAGFSSALGDVGREVARLARSMKSSFRRVRGDIRELGERIDRLERTTVRVGRMVALERRVHAIEEER